jgi:hypothetical protein
MLYMLEWFGRTAELKSGAAPRTTSLRFSPFNR